MRRDSDFAPRFRLALQALRLSRAAAASRLQVDKSLVGRWAAGSVVPTEHNLSRITQLMAQQFPHFTGIDWDRELDEFATLIGLDAQVALNAVAQTGEPTALHLKTLELAREETGRRGGTYEGFWRTSRPSALMRDKVFHDYGLIRRAPSGLLEVAMAGSGLSYSGWAFPLEGNLFSILDQSTGFTPLFLIFRGVALPKATLLEGLALMAAMDAGRTPVAFPLFLERIGDLTGDRQADDEYCRKLVEECPHEDAADVEPRIRECLFRPGIAGDSVTDDPIYLFAQSIHSRGTTLSGDLQG